MSAIARVAAVAPALVPGTSASASTRRATAVRAPVVTARADRNARGFVRRAGAGCSGAITSSHFRDSASRHRVHRLHASNDDTGSLLDELDADQRCPVPKDQRPSSQLQEIQDSLLLGWGGKDLPGYAGRLTTLGAFFYFTLAYPIASVSYDPQTQPVEAIICACTGSFTAVAVFALLIYNNWSYVRDRLLSATVEYEETGWYDGQVYVKDPEMLARDRLLGTYVVRPIVERLRKTLFACGVGVFISLGALNTIDAPEYGVDGKDFYDIGGAGFYKESSMMKYEPPATAEELAAEEAEEAAELLRYEAAMDRYQRDAKQNAQDAASGLE